ncbi:acylneuraminate cytidylyltransferase family protein [Alphaproteobacteria bacterium]|nr:acylneuraminate cytidylyltransferase family protein [Alphaproteobacteria bacterium]
MKVTALLPIKAHSERVKGKNFKNFCGKPLYKWMLDTLLNCSEVNKVIINTDASELINHYKSLNDPRLLVRKRKQELCGDHVSMNLIIKDDIIFSGSEVFLMTHATNPLLSKDTISQAIEKFDRLLTLKEADSLFGVTKFQTRFYSREGKPLNHDPNNLVRTQDLPTWYEENSCIYLFTDKSFNKTNARIGDKPDLFEVPKLEAIDIDEKEDWFLATVVAKGRENLDNYA